jgi:hypothetical protein
MKIIAKSLLIGFLCAHAANGQSTFDANEADYVLCVVVDMSGSYAEMMAKDGRAFTFMTAVVDKFFRDQLGSNGRLIISQISGNKKSLIWEGRTLDLRRDFTPETFRDFLIKKSDPNGSLVHESLARSLEYLMAQPAIANGKAKAALFVLSDMEHNGERTPELRDRVKNGLAKFGKLGGIVGLYYVSEENNLAEKWQTVLREAGIRDFRVESEIVSKPSLPSFRD